MAAGKRSRARRAGGKGSHATFNKGIVRTIRGSLKRFVALAVICALGTAMLVGLTVACKDLRYSADAFYDSQQLYDIRVVSTLGLTDDDIEALAQIEGVEAAEGGWSETVYTTVGSASEKVDVQAISESGMNAPYVVEGRLPESDDEIAVTRAFLAASGLEIGDTVSFHSDSDSDEDDSEDDDEDDDSDDSSEVFKRQTYTIVGSVLDCMNINNDEGTMSFRSTGGAKYAFFVTEDCVTSDVYTVVYVQAESAASLMCYTDAYEDLIEELTERIDAISAEREEARTAEVVAEATEEIDDAEAEALEEIADAQDEIDEAQAELDDGQAEIDDGQAEIDEAQAEIDDGQAEIADAEAELADGEQELADGWDEYEEERASALAQIDEAQAEIDEGYAQLEAAEAELDAAQAELDENLATIEASEAELEENAATVEESYAQVVAGIEQLEAGIAEMEAAEEELASSRATLEAAGEQLVAAGLVSEASWSALANASDAATAQAAADQIDAELDAVVAAYPAYAGQVEQAKQVTAGMVQVVAGEEELAAASPTLEELKAQLEELEATRATLEAALEEIEAGRAELEAARAQIEAAQEEIDAGYAEIAANKAVLDEAQATLTAESESAYAQLAEAEATLLAAEQELEDGKAELEDAKQELEDGQAELDDAQAELDDGQAELDDGQAELDDAQAELDEALADALAEIADARAEVDDIEDATWYIQDRTSISSYSSVDSDASSIEAIGQVIPLIFVIVAVLISLTTMTRMVDEERTLVGLYKALGYSRGRIMSKYALYAVAAVLAGVGTGYLLGFIVLPLILFYIFGTMYALPAFYLYFSLPYAAAALGAFGLCIVGATMWSARSALREQPADLMRPKTPKAGQRILLERIAPLWRRLSFLNKVTARNLFRYKRRMLMTVIGIAGTTALLVVGFGVRDTVIELDEWQYGEDGMNAYDLMVVTAADDLDDVAVELAEEDQVSGLTAVYTDSVTVKYDGESVSAQLIVVPDGSSLEGYIEVTEWGSGESVDVAETVAGADSGAAALLTANAAQVLGFSEGDTVTAQDSTLAEGELEVVEIVETYLGNTVFMTRSAYEAAYGEATELNCLLVTLTGTAEEQVALSEELTLDSRYLSVTSTQKLYEDFSDSVALINMVVWIIIVFAAALSFTVVFTLSNTNISEREREIATIKVLGFRYPEVHTYINKETVLLTVIGILVGLPLGYAVTASLEWILKMPSLYFAVTILPVSYLISAAIAVVFTLVINQMTNRSLDRINMVEALKSAE